MTGKNAEWTHCFKAAYIQQHNTVCASLCPLHLICFKSLIIETFNTVDNWHIPCDSSELPQICGFKETTVVYAHHIFLATSDLCKKRYCFSNVLFFHFKSKSAFVSIVYCIRNNLTTHIIFPHQQPAKKDFLWLIKRGFSQGLGTLMGLGNVTDGSMLFKYRYNPPL